MGADVLLMVMISIVIVQMVGKALDVNNQTPPLLMTRAPLLMTRAPQTPPLLMTRAPQTHQLPPRPPIVTELVMMMNPHFVKIPTKALLLSVMVQIFRKNARKLATSAHSQLVRMTNPRFVKIPTKALLLPVMVQIFRKNAKRLATSAHRQEIANHKIAKTEAHVLTTLMISSVVVQMVGQGEDVKSQPTHSRPRSRVVRSSRPQSRVLRSSRLRSSRLRSSRPRSSRPRSSRPRSSRPSFI